MSIYTIYVLCTVLLIKVGANVINIPQDYFTIQNGINSSISGDTILVSPGEYYENINFLGKNIIVGSLFLVEDDTSYISQTQIFGDTALSVVVFENGEDSTSKLIGLTIRDGFGTLLDPELDGSFEDYGGGILCINASPSLINLNITGNYISSGGGAGIYLGNSSSIINSVKIYNNISDNIGGGIYCRDQSSLKVLNSIIYSNSAVWGGEGIYCHDSSNIIIQDCKIFSNIGSNKGVVFIRDSPNSRISNVKIANNHCASGIYCASSIISMDSVSVHDNSGTGIMMHNSEIQVSSSNFYGNTFSGIIMNSSNSDLFNVRIFSNSSSYYGCPFQKCKLYKQGAISLAKRLNSPILF